MSLTRPRIRRDQNEPGIVDALRRAGAIVQRITADNVPDLLVGFRGQTYLLEVKSGNNDLSDGQAQWMLEWRGGPCCTVWCVADALEAIGAIDSKHKAVVA